MNIQVGGDRYHIRDGDDYLYLNHQPVWSICDHPRQEIIIAGRAGRTLRRRIIAHAILAIVAHHHQPPRSTLRPGADLPGDRRYAFDYSNG